MSYCKKNSVRDTAIGKRWIVRTQREAHSKRVGHRVCWPWNVGWLVFMSWVFHMLMSGRIIPTIGKPPTPWSFDSALEFWMCHLACRLRIKVQLKLTCLSSWTHLILIGLCYALGLCHYFKSCALPPSLLFHALFLSPVQAHNVASTVFWKDNQKVAGPWEGNTVWYPIPLDIQAFIFHVSYNTCNNSISQCQGG